MQLIPQHIGLRSALRGAAAALVLAVAAGYSTQALADGLGGLSALRWVFGFIIVIVGIGLVVVIPGLIRAFILRRRGEEGTRAQQVYLGIAIAYLLLLSPIAIGMMTAPRLSVWLYAAVAGYLALLAITILYFYDNRKHVFVAVGLVFVLVVLSTPEIVSFTRYEYVENMPLDNSIGLLEQKDSEYLPLEDGRLFYVEKRYNSGGPGDLAPPGARFTVTPVAGDDALYDLDGLGRSQAYHDHANDIPDPLVTIPLRGVSINLYDSRRIGRARLLGDDWQADDSVLQRATNAFCCDPEWVGELLARGADARTTYRSSRWTVLHTMAGKSPYGPDVNETARLLIRNGADVNAIGSLGRSAFHATLKEAQRDAFREDKLQDSQREYLALLLELGADPNTRDKRGLTPLHDTVHGRFYSLSHLLLRHGADPTVENNKGRSALTLARYYLNEQKAVLSDAEERDLARLIDAMDRVRVAAGRAAAKQ